MRHTLTFYLNDDNITDDFIIKELKTEKNVSGLVKSLLWDYYKYSKPYVQTKEQTKMNNESEVTNNG